MGSKAELKHSDFRCLPSRMLHARDAGLNISDFHWFSSKTLDTWDVGLPSNGQGQGYNCFFYRNERNQ